LRLRSSSDAEAMRSSRAGSGGTTVGSATGSGGAGGRCPGAAGVGGGGIGRVTGDVFLPQPANITIEMTNTAASVVNRGVNRMHIASAPWYAVCRGRPAHARSSFRPVRLIVVSRARDLLQILAVARDRENVRLAGAVRREREVPAVGRPAR